MFNLQKKPDEIKEKINKFFCDYDLNDGDIFSDEDFESYKNSVITFLEEKDYNLLSEFNRNIGQLFLEIIFLIFLKK